MLRIFCRVHRPSHQRRRIRRHQPQTGAIHQHHRHPSLSPLEGTIRAHCQSHPHPRLHERPLPLLWHRISEPSAVQLCAASGLGHGPPSAGFQRRIRSVRPPGHQDGPLSTLVDIVAQRRSLELAQPARRPRTQGACRALDHLVPPIIRRRSVAPIHVHVCRLGALPSKDKGGDLVRQAGHSAHLRNDSIALDAPPLPLEGPHPQVCYVPMGDPFTDTDDPSEKPTRMWVASVTHGHPWVTDMGDPRMHSCTSLE